MAKTTVPKLAMPEGSFDSLVSDPAPTSALQQAASGSFDSLVDDEDNYGGVTGEAKAAAAGVARGATFGLSDQAMTRSGLVAPETLKGLQETNPVSSVGGELAGAIAPAFLGDEAGLANLPGTVSKIGGAVERGAAKFAPQAIGKPGTSIAAKALGFWSEGALYGLGQAVSENALGDHDLVSEKTLADVGMSAVFAGGLGSLVGAYGSKWGALAKDASTGEQKLAAQALSQTIDPLSPEGALINSGMPARDKVGLIEGLQRQKDNAAEIIAAGNEIGAPVLPAQTSASKFIQDSTSAISKDPTIPGVITQQTIQKGFDAVDGVIKSTLGGASELTEKEAGQAIVDHIQDAVDKIYQPIKEGFAADEAAGNAIKLADNDRLKLYDKLTELSQNSGSVGSDSEKLVSSLAERALAQNTGKNMTDLISEVGALRQKLAATPGSHKEAFAAGQVKDMLEEFLMSQTEKNEKNLVKGQLEQISGQPVPQEMKAQMMAEAQANAEAKNAQRKDLRKSYSGLKEILNDLAADGKLGKRSKTVGGLDNTFNSIAPEKILSKFFDPKNSDGLSRLIKNFPEAAEVAVQQKKSQIFNAAMKDGKPQVGKVLKELDKLSPEIKELMFTPQELKKLEASKTWVESLPRDLNPSGTAMAHAYQHLLKNPISGVVQNFPQLATKKLIDFAASSPEEAAKLTTLANTQKAAIKTSNRVDASISSILGKLSRPASEKVFSKINNNDDFQEQTKRIQTAVNDTQGLMDKMTNETDGLYAHAPKITGSMQQGMVRGLQFLNSKIPQNQPQGVFQSKPQASNTEIAKFKRYYDVVEDPVSALTQVKNATLTPETIETLSNVYPKLYDDMKSSMINAIGKIDDKSAIPYRTKQMVSMFMGEPLDPSMQFQNVMANQATFQPAPPPQAQGAQKKPTLGGLSKLTVADRTSVGSAQSNI